MASVKCPCGFDSGIKLPSSYNVGVASRKLDMAWIMLEDGHSVWICRTCEKLVHDAATRISNILGSTSWIASSVMPHSQEMRPANG